MSDDAKLKVEVLSPTKTLFSGMAKSVSANNEVGPFDILADHANFFSLLSEGHVVVSDGFQNFSFPITKGLLKVKDNNVTLFVDIEPAYLTAQTNKQ